LWARIEEEAVFSSSEDQIRASQASVTAAGPSIVPRRIFSHESFSRLRSISTAQVWHRRIAEGLFSVLFPSDCRICGEPLLNISRLPVCLDCLASIHPIRGKLCSICGERVLSSYAQSDDDGLRRCPVCRRVERPFGRAAAYGSYDGGLRELIHLLKFNGVRPAANVLGRMLAEAITALESSFDEAGLFDAGSIAVVPVPLFKAKRRQRRFNQSELIARAALKFYPARGRFQLVPDLLVRTRDTHSQIGLTSHQRRANLRGAFAVSRDAKAEIKGREVLLVDDVYTTGTTATECARVLRRAGASRVWVATVARTLKLASNYAEFRPEEPEEAEVDAREAV
jgi:ComF family protein